MIIFNNQSHKKKKKNLKHKTKSHNQSRVLKNTKLYQAKIEMQEKKKNPPKN